MKKMMITLALSLGAIASTGCGRVNNADYDNSCSADDECVIAYRARDCRCSEPMSVNVSERDEVQRDNERVDRRAFCPNGTVDCGAPNLEAYCNQGTCETREPTGGQE